MDLSYEEQVELSKLIDNYETVAPFVRKHKWLNFMQFDYAVVHDLTLFTVGTDLGYTDMEARIDTILETLPAIKRIFAQPCIHLREHNEILPTEAVRIINNKTIQHISSHSELWSNVKKDDIKPAKLLTRTYEDDYGIYENLVFCKTVDDVLLFAARGIRFLDEFFYTNRTIEINLLERVNHLNYFLALGKLHTGYSRYFDEYQAVLQRCHDKLRFIYNGLIPRLRRPVYKYNKHRPRNIKLHKTNILSMHREYKRVYKLAKYMAAHNISAGREITAAEVTAFQVNYFNFCAMLCIFAVAHFNFDCNEKKAFDLSAPDITFTFKDWAVTVKSSNSGACSLIKLFVQKDVGYTVILIPSVSKHNGELLELIKASEEANEYIVCTPYEEADGEYALIDMSSIESFRRIQQMILRAMINTDEDRVDCPFCNNKLERSEERSREDHDVYICASCRTEIHDTVCPEKGEPYTYTRIAGFSGREPESDGEGRFRRRELEARMYFRNITELGADSEIICPHCGHSHENK